MDGSLRFVGRNHSLPAERLSYPVFLAQCLLSTVHAQMHHPEIERETHCEGGRTGILFKTYKEELYALMQYLCQMIYLQHKHTYIPV